MLLILVSLISQYTSLAVALPNPVAQIQPAKCNPIRDRDADLEQVAQSWVGCSIKRLERTKLRVTQRTELAPGNEEITLEFRQADRHPFSGLGVMSFAALPKTIEQICRVKITAENEIITDISAVTSRLDQQFCHRAFR